MGKDKLRRFRENLTFPCFIQPAFEEAFGRDHPLKGHWHRDFFRNDRPIVLELGCGKGEYTVALAERDPQRNFIGIDIKGARMWRGAKTVTERGMTNAGFLRTRIEFIESFFAPGEVAEIWITFPDPQLKTRRAKKRLTSPLFLGRYARLLAPDGLSASRPTRSTSMPTPARSSGISASPAMRPATTSTAAASPTRCFRSKPPMNGSSSSGGCPSPTPRFRSAAVPTSRHSTGRAISRRRRTAKRRDDSNPSPA